MAEDTAKPEPGKPGSGKPGPEKGEAPPPTRMERRAAPPASAAKPSPPVKPAAPPPPAKPAAPSAQAAPAAGADADRRKPWRGASAFGYGVVFLFFGLFGGWAATAPLASAVIANGKLQVESKRKRIQHPTGGTVDEILVREGDRVRKGQVLLRMEETQTRAHADVLNNTRDNLLALKARLIAERDGLDRPVFPAALLSRRDDPAVAQILASTLDGLTANRLVMEETIALHRKHIEQSRSMLDALDVRDKSFARQLQLIEEELADVGQMVRKGLERKTRLRALQRSQSSLQGQRGEIAARRAQTLQRIASRELEINAVRQKARQQAVERLHKTEQELEKSASQLAVIGQQLRNIEIRSPRNGMVMNLRITAVGNVIRAGEGLMEVVPEDDPLVVVANIPAKDIDAVRVGASAQVRLQAFNVRIMPPLDGVLESVSPGLVDTPYGPFFQGIVRIDPESIRQNLGDQPLRSGMNASAVIAVSERTLLAYWITPLTASFETSLREH